MTFKASKTSPAKQKTKQIDKPESPKSRFTDLSWVLKDALVLSCIGLAFFLFIILFSYDAKDPGFESAGADQVAQNYGGKTGAWLSSFILYFFGVFGFLIPFGVFMAGWVTLKIRAGSEMDFSRFFLSLTGLFFLIFSGAGLASLYLEPSNALIDLPYSGGGVLGYELSQSLVDNVDLLGATLVLLVMLALSFSLFSSYSWLTIIEVTGALCYSLYEKVSGQAQQSYSKQLEKHQQRKENGESFFKKTEDKQVEKRSADSDVKMVKKDQHDKDIDLEQVKSTDEDNQSEESNLTKQKNKVMSLFKDKKEKLKDKVKEKIEEKDKQETPVDDAEEQESPPFEVDVPKGDVAQPGMTSDVKVGKRASANSTVPVQASGDLPSVDLLDPIPEYDESFSEEYLKNLSGLLEQRLQEFGVSVKVESVQPGPVVTRFEILPAPGVKVSQINNLAKDLARVLSVKSVRVVDVIPGKSVVGIEIPNDEREVVSFRDVISSKEFQESDSPLTVALGKDIAGNAVVANIAKMPHLLVAGTTGSGKSVGVNSMILSLLYKATPDDVRLIMVDPKMLELSVYEDIPHLLTPVVTDMSDAANALRWCVFEMDRRYQLMAKVGVRNIAGYNAKVKGAIDAGKPIIDPLYQQAANFGHELGESPPTLEPLPFIVVVVDEFADMIMVVGKEVEQLIARIAQKARAAGIHLILATQRPSVNVITGLIKANIPTRISFMVNTKIDSRTILDQGGAEQLLGMGDMLFMPPGTGTPKRVHGAFMTDDEVHQVAEFVKSQGQPQYLEAVTQAPSSGGDADDDDAEQDKLYDEVVGFVVEGRKVSVSMVQRRFKIGYNRAARIVEAMERAGVISTAGANGNREVLAPKPENM